MNWRTKWEKSNFLHAFCNDGCIIENIVAHRPVAKQWLCKQRPLLGNDRNAHARINRTKGLCNPFLNIGSVNTHATIRVLLETILSIRSVQNIYKAEFHTLPCGGRVEYLHRNPASRRRRCKGKSPIWDSKIWSRVPWDSPPSSAEKKDGGAVSPLPHTSPWHVA
jgi:hypothetical protein